jgi:hypothetical protein
MVWQVILLIVISSILIGGATLLGILIGYYGMGWVLNKWDRFIGE